MSNPSRRTFLAAVPVSVSAAELISRLSDDDQTSISSPEHPLKLWYKQPAPSWTDALPVGNGRLGAMVFGGVETERLAINDDTLWSGAPRDWNNPHASEYLPQIRKLVLDENKYEEADAVCKKMQGPYNESYLPIADLVLSFDYPNQASATATDYRRELDLDTAIAKVTYSVGEVAFTREVFSSVPDQVLVVRLTANQPGKLHFTAKLASKLHANAKVSKANTLNLAGKAPAHVAPNYFDTPNPVVYSDAEGQGMRFGAACRIVPFGGTLRATGDGIHLKGADSALLFVATATGFKGYTQVPNTPLSNIQSKLDKTIASVSSKSYASVRASHVRDHQRLFRRMAIDLGGSNNASIPTDERLNAFENANDQSLLALYFQYGRYLLITSSRPGTQAANLQGIWNDHVRPPWSSNWTANINVQMNYWPAETCNLTECAQPLFDLIEGVSLNGRTTAQVNYKAGGWVSHHNIDVWRQSAPVGDYGKGDATWANWQMSGPWLCAHLWEHYLFTGDKAFLARVYPVLKGSAEFCLDWLIESGGHLTTCPSFSTENDFIAPNGKRAVTSAGCTMDIALIREVFANTIEAGKLLGKDHDFRGTLEKSRSRLPNYQVGPFGQLLEWSKDFKEAEPGQRHMSHLYPLFPGSEFTPRHKPEFWKASRVSLERRLANGGAYTGWSRAWAINLWARLEDGEKAYESLAMLMKHSTGPNLFDTHPADNGSIFQIDGNFGGTSAVAEMLLQSHEIGEINILPALPKAWPAGSIHGIRARGAMTIDIAWAEGKATTVFIRPEVSRSLKLRLPVGQQVTGATVDGKPDHVSSEDGLPLVNLKSGRVHELHVA